MQPVRSLSGPWLVQAHLDLLFIQVIATAVSLRGAEEGPCRAAVGI